MRAAPVPRTHNMVQRREGDGGCGKRGGASGSCRRTGVGWSCGCYGRLISDARQHASSRGRRAGSGGSVPARSQKIRVKRGRVEAVARWCGAGSVAPPESSYRLLCRSRHTGAGVVKSGGDVPGSDSSPSACVLSVGGGFWLTAALAGSCTGGSSSLVLPPSPPAFSGCSGDVELRVELLSSSSSSPLLPSLDLVVVAADEESPRDFRVSRRWRLGFL
jgi:hypothetical protein